MSEKHDKLKSKAKAAIEELFSDTSVSQEKSADSLQELIEDMQMMIESLSVS